MATGSEQREDKTIILDENLPDPLERKNNMQPNELFLCKLPIESVLVKGKKSGVTKNRGWNNKKFGSVVVNFETDFILFQPLEENQLEQLELHPTPYPILLEPHLSNEISTNTAFYCNVLQPMLDLFENRFRVHPQQSIQDFQADICLTSRIGEEKFLVIEIKRWAAFMAKVEAHLSTKVDVTKALAEIIDLNQEVVNEDTLKGDKNNRKDNETDHCYNFRIALKQLRAYLWSLNKTVAFGILSSYCHTYFVILRRLLNENPTLTVSPVVKYSEEGVLRKIASFIQLSRTSKSVIIQSTFTLGDDDDESYNEESESEDSPDGGGEEKRQTKRFKKDHRSSGDSYSCKSRPTVSGIKTKQAGSGEYIRCDIIGEGRCGHVWQVIDCEGRKFAVKSVSHFKDERRFEVASIIHELKNEKQIYRKLKDLQGVVVPQFYFSAYLPGSTYSLFMEELDAEPIRQQDLLREQKEAILDALGQMHGKKILHGDIREENILLDRQNPKQVFFIDFGRSSECDSVADLKREMDELKALLRMV